MTEKKFDVLSPDGFSIHFSDVYNSKKEAIKAVKDWVKGYENQGYYSSVKYGRIDYLDIIDYCKLVEVEL